MNKGLIGGALSAILFFCGVPLHAEEPSVPEKPTLVFNTVAYPILSTPKEDGFIDSIIRETFQRLGMNTKFIFVPAERALINVNEGIDDGLTLRIAGLEKRYPERYPNVFHVPEKLFDIHFSVYAGKDKPDIAAWEDLNAYSVGFITGWKIFERQMKEHPNVFRAKNPEQLFQMLENGRIDYALYNKWNGLGFVRDMQLKNVRILDKPVIVKEMVMYLNKKHAALLPEITKTVREIKADGTYDRLFKEKVQPLLPTLK